MTKQCLAALLSGRGFCLRQEAADDRACLRLAMRGLLTWRRFRITAVALLQPLLNYGTLIKEDLL